MLGPPWVQRTVVPHLCASVETWVEETGRRGRDTVSWTQKLRTHFSLQFGTVKPPSHGNDVSLASLLHKSVYMICKNLTKLHIMYHVFVKWIHKYVLAYLSKTKSEQIPRVLRIKSYGKICLWKIQLSNHKPQMGFNGGKRRVRVWGSYQTCGLKWTLATEKKKWKGLNMWHYWTGHFSALVHKIIKGNCDC